MKPTTHTSTPWGPADDVEAVAPGITWYSTPSHGGFRLDAKRRAQLAPAVRKYDECSRFTSPGWFEEDVEAALVILSFPEAFPDTMPERMHTVVARYMPADVCAAFGITPDPRS
jgi:hypothetical protein